MMTEKAGPDGSSVSEVYIYYNNRNMIAVVAVRTNIDDDFLSR
jgi:hypothetical protein